MTVNELLNDLILDLKDYIYEYEYDVKTTNSRVEKYEKRIRADELRRWLESLYEIREEQS